MAALAKSFDFDGEYLFAANDNIHTDKQNSVVALTNSSGAPVSRRGYGTYGETNPTQMAETTHPFGYTGRRWESDLGLYYYRARWYVRRDTGRSPGDFDPRRKELGTFLETDPIGSLDYINLYSYVGLNPMNATDPSGMLPTCSAPAVTPPSTADKTAPTLLPATCGDDGTELTPVDTVIVTAQRNAKKSKGDEQPGPIDFNSEIEQFINVTDGVLTVAEPAKRERCAGGIDRNHAPDGIFDKGVGGHSHTNKHASGIGDDDGVAARKSTANTAYMVSRDGAWRIGYSNSTGYSVTSLMGGWGANAEDSTNTSTDIANMINSWNRNSGSTANDGTNSRRCWTIQ